MDSLDTHLFLEIILSEGAELLYSSNNYDTSVEYYTGPSGSRVLICVSDEEISANTCKFYLDQLGLARLIDRLFPPTPPENAGSD